MVQGDEILKTIAILLVFASFLATAWAAPAAAATPAGPPTLAGWAALQPRHYAQDGREIPFSATPYFQRYHPEYFTNAGGGGQGSPASVVTPVLRVAGAHSNLYVDSAARPQPSDADCQALSGQFDSVIWPVDTGVFGSPGPNSIDIYIYSIDGAGGVGGYYSGGNAIYGDSSDMSWMPEILAHEFQHRIHSSKDSNEDLWVNEGCADLAIQLCLGASYAATSLGSHISAFEANPDNDLTVFNNELYDYGSAYAFLSYFREHFGGNDTIRALVADPANGIQGFNDRLAGTGQDFASVFRSWTVANYLDNGSIPGDYGYADISIKVQATRVQAYPYSASASVNRWAADYFVFTAGGADLAIRFNGQDTAPLEISVGKVGRGSVPSSVERMTIDSARDGNLTVPRLGLDYSEVAVVVSASTSGGSYSLAAETVDMNGPVTTLAVDPARPDTADGWYTRTPTLSLSSNEPGAAIFYHWDGSGDVSYSGPLQAAEGAHVLHFHSVDLAGNAEAEHAVPVSVDTKPPATNLSVAPPDGRDGWYVTSPEIALSSESGAAIYYRWEGQAEARYYGPFWPPEGLSTLDYRSVDLHGNAEAGRTAGFKVDTAGPISTIHTDPAQPDGQNGWFIHAPVVMLDTEPQGELFYSWDGGREEAYVIPFAAQEGRHVLRWHAVDPAGNREQNHSININVDSIAPTATATLSPEAPDGNAGYFRSNVTVTILTDPDASAIYRWGTGAWINYTGPIRAPEGQTTLYYSSVDGASNRAEEQSLDLSVDTVPPVTNLSMEPDAGGEWISEVPAVSLSTEPMASTFWHIDGGKAVKYTGHIQLTAGRHTLWYYSVDAAGNAEAPRSRAYALDLSDPIANLAAGNLTALPGKEVRFNASGSADADSGVRGYRFVFGDGTDSGWMTEPVLSHSFARPGRYTVSLTVRDGTGRMSSPATVSMAVGIAASKLGPAASSPPAMDRIQPFLPYIGLAATLAAAVALAVLGRRKGSRGRGSDSAVVWD